MNRQLAKFHALEAAQRFIDTHHQRFERGLAKLAPTQGERAKIHALVHSDRLGAYMPKSNKAVLLAAHEALVDELHDLFERTAPDFRLLTLTWADGFTFEHKPVANIPAMIAKARGALESLGLEAVGAVEIEFLSRCIDDEPSRRFIFHIHAACWKRGGRFATRTYERAIAQMEFSHPWDAAPARFTSPKRVSGMPKGSTWQSIAGLGLYLLKAPRIPKKRVPKRDGEGFMLRHAPLAEYSPAIAVRLMELYSRFCVTELMFGAGPHGEAVFQSWLIRMRKWAASRQPAATPISTRAAARLWNGLYQRSDAGPYSHYRPARLRQAGPFQPDTM